MIKRRGVSRPKGILIMSLLIVILGIFTFAIGILGYFLGEHLNEEWAAQIWIAFATKGIIPLSWPSALIDMIIGLVYVICGILIFKMKHMELASLMTLGIGLISVFIYGIGEWSAYVQETVYGGLGVAYLRVILQGVIPMVAGAAAISMEREEAKTVLGRRIRGFWLDFSHNKIGLVGAAIILAYVAGAVLVPVLSFGVDPEATDLADDRVPPEWITIFNPSLNDLPRSTVYNLNFSLDMASIPDFIKNSTGFNVTYGKNSTILKMEGISFPDDEPICIVFKSDTFNYPYRPPRGGGFNIQFELSVDPYLYYELPVPGTNITRTMRSKRALYNVEVNFSNPLNTYSIWDAEWSIHKITYLSQGYNASALLEPIDLAPAKDRLIDAKQSFSVALSTDLYWAYRMGHVDAHGSVDAQALANDLFASKGNYSVTMYVFVAPYQNKPVYFKLQVKTAQVTVRGLLWGLMGTDHLGRDVWSRVVHGIKISLAIGLAAAVVSIAMGVMVGVVSGYLGGVVDEALMRLVDILLCLPVLPLLMVLVYMYGRNVWYIVILIAVFGWQGLSRVIRSQVLSLRESAFVECAVASGASRAYIMFRHLIPNVLPIVLADFVLSVPGAIMSEASLSFIGFGDPTTPTWGREFNIMWTEGGAFTYFCWWWIFPPGIAITLLCLAFVFLGHAVDEIVNPRLRRRR